ncbi:putative ABC transporter permease [Enterococcus dongliensis]|uniref:putative ABC transporter permease n=1 Tax=Enterococcus dongliensis TaxID=2559925 RepID=UPI002891A4A4|nr:putative ABC transporter permease [Enterococcus dongliensis]MDT2672927.1 putative ABC transporter permease [Enterococcus dongliensis]
MEQVFTNVVLLFFCYSFIGWLWETVYCSIKARHFVYRGFLLGPITPIYGFGVVGVLYLIEPYQQNIVLLFFLALILVTVLEYLTSFLLEKIFHLTLWDYKDVPLNINGRIAVPVSLFWGVACVFIVRVLNPYLMHLITGWQQRFGLFLPMILLMVISFDLGFTLANLASLRQAMNKMSTTIQDKKEQVQADLGELKVAAEERLQNHQWLTEIKEQPEWRKQLPKLNFQERRFLTSFPNMKSKEIKSPLTEIRQLAKELRKK